MKVRLFVAILMLSFLGLASCSDEQTEVSVNYDRTGTIKGYVYTTAVNKLGEMVYDVAKNTTIYVLVPYSELTGDPTIQGEKRFSTTTDSKGVYSIAVPATDEGVDVTVVTETVEGSSYSSIGGEMKPIEVYYKSQEYQVNVKAGIFSIKDITLDYTPREVH